MDGSRELPFVKKRKLLDDLDRNKSCASGKPATSASVAHPSDSFSDFKVVSLTSSKYLKPLRVEFTMNNVKKNWDFLQIHDSVSILIYNKTRNVIVLVKQFRPSAYVAHIPDIADGTVIDPEKYPVADGYTIELCAGLVDKDLPLVDVAKEEIFEECGYDIPSNHIQKIFSFRNVGVTGQTSNIFYAEVEDADKIAPGGGLRAEGEFLEIVEMDVEEFRTYLNSVNLNSPPSLATAGIAQTGNVGTPGNVARERNGIGRSMSWRARWGSMNPYDLHKLFINEYVLTKKGSTSLLQRDTSRDKRDIDVIRENHQFLWDEETDLVDTWEKKIAKKYYDKLFKEYCVGDLTHYKENKFGFRWRTEKEVIDGKGQFVCGSKHCDKKNKLKTWEVNFGYVEQGVKKNALVKLRLCSKCSKKLNYRFKRKEAKRLKTKKSSKVAEPCSSASVSSNPNATQDETPIPVPETSEKSNNWQSETVTTEKSEDQDVDDFLQDLFF